MKKIWITFLFSAAGLAIPLSSSAHGTEHSGGVHPVRLTPIHACPAVFHGFPSQQAPADSGECPTHCCQTKSPTGLAGTVFFQAPLTLTTGLSPSTFFPQCPTRDIFHPPA